MKSLEAFLKQVGAVAVAVAEAVAGTDMLLSQNL